MDSDLAVTDLSVDGASDISWQHDPVIDADVQEISKALLLLVVAGERLVRDLRTSDRGVDSPAELHFSWPENPENAEGSTHVQSAQASLLTSFLASADHVRAFVQGVRSRRTTVSNWTLARGAIEPLASMHYLLLSKSPKEFFGRHVELVLAETKYDTTKEYAYRYGNPISVEEYREGFLTMATERGIQISKNGVSLTKLASSLIDDVAPGSEGRRRYSELSSVAHGQAPGVHMFIPDMDGVIALPRVLILDSTQLQAACLIHVGDELVRYFKPREEVSVRWAQARLRSMAVLFSL